MSNIIDKIQISGTNYDLKDVSAVTVVDILQADYDLLPESAKTSNIIYNITDAPQVNINDYVSKAQNVVPNTYVYAKYTSDFQTSDTVKVRNVKIVYSGNNDTVTGYMWLYGNNNYSANVYPTFNFTAGTITQSETDRIDYTYDADSKTFTVFIKDEYYDSTWINTFSFNSSDAVLLAGLYPIHSGQTAQVVSGDTLDSIGESWKLALSSVGRINMYPSKNKFSLNYAKNYEGNSANNSGGEIIFKDMIYDSNISAFVSNSQIPLGTMGWKSLYTSDTCTIEDVPNALKFSYTGSTSSYWNTTIFIMLSSNGNSTSFYDYVRYENGEPYINSNFLSNVGSGLTYSYDSTAHTLSVNYVDKVNLYEMEWDVTILSLRSSNCRFGNSTDNNKLYVEGYLENTEEIKQYVQDNRAAIQGKQDILSAGTGIEISGNVISVTGGGGGASYSAGTGIDITNDVISVTGMVATSAVTSAVTSGSTDVVTSGGVYDQLGGMKILHLTQAQYDALSPNYDNTTLYVITNS